MGSIGLLILRLVFGFSMFWGHGYGKIGRLFGPGPVEFGDPIGLGPVVSLSLATFAEVVCALLVMVGLYTRWATIPLIITMLVAFAIVHISDPFSNQEKAIMYLGAFITLFLTGPGYYSLDKHLRKAF